MRKMDSRAQEEGDVRSLYGELLACWNGRRAGDFAALFTPDGNCIGFDVSRLNGQSEIEASLRQVLRSGGMA